MTFTSHDGVSSIVKEGQQRELLSHHWLAKKLHADQADHSTALDELIQLGQARDVAQTVANAKLVSAATIQDMERVLMVPDCDAEVPPTDVCSYMLDCAMRYNTEPERDTRVVYAPRWAELCSLRSSR